MNKISSVVQLEQICIEPNLYTGSDNALGVWVRFSAYMNRK